MEEERISGDRARSRPGSERDDQNLEKKLSDAFAVLKLLSDDDNPMAFAQALACARREAERFRSWEESDAPITGVVIRGGDGGQVALIEGGGRRRASRYVPLSNTVPVRSSTSSRLRTSISGR
jgi:hypothetical protein